VRANLDIGQTVDSSLPLATLAEPPVAAAGVAGFLQKTYRSVDLIEAIGRVLTGR
jgi:hypothetical protein